MTLRRHRSAHTGYSQHQATEDLPALQKVFTRVVEQTSYPSRVIIELIATDASDKEWLAARSAPLHPQAAKTIAALCEQPVSMLRYFEGLQNVLSQAGPYAWGTAEASGPDAAAIAARQACRAIKNQSMSQRSALGTLVVITLSTDNRFVETIKTVFHTVRTELPFEAYLATAVNIDNDSSSRIRVELLVTGLQ